MGSSFIVAVLIVSITLSTTAGEFTITDEHLDPENLANLIANSLVERILSKTQGRFAKQSGRNSELLGSLIPPDLIDILPNIPLPDGSLNFDNLLLDGSYEHENTEIQGLNTLWDDLLIYIQTPFTVSYGIGVRDLAIQGNYSLNVGINLTYIMEQFPELPIEIPPDGVFIAPLVGSGGYELGLKDLGFNVSLAFNIDAGRIDSVNTSLSLELGALMIYFEDLVFNDVLPFENLWGLLNGLLTTGILELWAAVEEDLTELLDAILTGIVKDCLIVDFLNGDLSCIFPPPAPEPTTTTTTTTTTEAPTTSTTEKSGAEHSFLGVSLFVIMLFQMIVRNS